MSSTRPVNGRRAWRAAATLALLLAIGAAPALPQPPSGRPAETPPKLVVLLVVDQMRADYVERFHDEWTAGLARLVTHGAWFRRAAYPYLTTVTCAGHATISSGAFPHVSGVVQNAWWDRAAGRTMSCTADPNAHDIGYGQAAAGGDSAWRLQVPTLSDTLRRERAAHVVALSLKDRSAIMLAGHGGDAVVWLANDLSGWRTSSAFSAAPVDAVEQYLSANPIAADFGKTWTRVLPPRRYDGPDDGVGEAPPRGWTATFPHVLDGTGGETPTLPFYVQWERSPYANDYLGRMAAALAERLQLGTHDGTDVLAVSFSSTDLVGHAFGPASQEVQDMYLHLDRTVGTLLNRLDALVGRDRYVVALSSDHGVTPIPEQLVAEKKDAGRIDAAAIVRAVQQQAVEALGPGQYISSFSGTDLYFAPDVYEKLRASPTALSNIVAAIAATPGIEKVFRGEDLRSAAGATDPLTRAAALSYFPGRSGDLVLAPKAGWMFAPTGTTHQSSHPDDQDVPILLMGRGIKPGRYTTSATPADIAPTLAALCGVTMPSAEGRVLREALTSTKGRSSDPGQR
jgi:predicted AlkP superfamily pyrophosphatase or phosphodiesterase